MKFHEQKLPGVFLIEPEPFVDERGTLRRHFCQDEMAAHGIAMTVRQGNISENPRRHTLRGFHFQYPPFGEAKMLSCVRGAIYDIIVDLRPTSPTYLRWARVELSEENRLTLFVPAGCGNAWMTLTEHTWIHYYHSEVYTPGAEGGIRYNDPLFGFVWPAAPALVSARDTSHPDFVPQPPAR